MSRHRNVRSMNYAEEYDGYDDVYGHSVEDDYSISPSDAGYVFDRSQKSQMSAFMTGDEDIAEEDEGIEEESERKKRRDSEILGLQQRNLSDFDEARLRSCLDEIRNVIGDTVSEASLADTILANNFDVAKSLDSILSSASSDVNKSASKSRTPISDLSAPQERKVQLEKGGWHASNKLKATEQPTIVIPGTDHNVIPLVTAQPTIKVVPPGVKTINVTKGFEVLSVKQDADEGLRPVGTPRTQSPSSGRSSPHGMDSGESDSLAREARVKSRVSKADILARYERERGGNKQLLHLVVIGHVDAGKSTLMGRFLFEMGQVAKKTMHKYEQESKKLGKQSFMYAWILDETGEERSRGITMDVGQSKFETRTKQVTLLDAPGHKDFIPNMITGATQADVALLVVDATRGEFETGFESGGQTREHALLVRSLGVSQLGVVVNKLDTVGWSQERFQEITGKLSAFLRQAGFRESDVTYVPCSGLTGENLVAAPTVTDLTSWYSGPCLLEVIDNFKAPERPVTKPFRLSVNDIFKGMGAGFCVSGKVETGMVQSGEKVLVQPQGETATIKALMVDEMPIQCAFAGDCVSATLAGIDQQNIAVGYILCDLHQPIPVTTRFEARIVVFQVRVPITKGYPVVMHHQSLVEQAIVSKLVAQLHKSTGAVLKQKPRCLVGNSVALVELQTTRPVSVELYSEVKELGRIMLRVGGVTIAAGLITQILN